MPSGASGRRLHATIIPDMTTGVSPLVNGLQATGPPAQKNAGAALIMRCPGTRSLGGGLVRGILLPSKAACQRGPVHNKSFFVGHPLIFCADTVRNHSVFRIPSLKRGVS